MAAKSIVKDDVKQLKVVVNDVQDWAARVQESFDLTCGLCKCMAKAACHNAGDVKQLDDLLLESSKALSGAVGQVTQLVSLRTSEIFKEAKKKGILTRYCRSPSYGQEDVQQKVCHAHAAIGLALLDAMQLQARELDRIAMRAMTLHAIRTSTPGKQLAPPLTPTYQGPVASPENGWTARDAELGRSMTSGDTCDIDWEAFEGDVQAMTNAVGGSCISDAVASSTTTDQISVGHELVAIRAHLKEAEIDRDDAVQRAEEAEESLRMLHRQHKLLLEESQKFYTEDDVLELRRALKFEQVARLNMEAELRAARMSARAAEDDAQASQYALTVAQQVAAKMATDTLLQRRCSSGPVALLHSRTPSGGSEADVGTEDLGMMTSSSGALGSAPNIMLSDARIAGTDVDRIERQVASNADALHGEEPISTSAATRTDSAFMLRPEDTASQATVQVTDASTSSPHGPSIANPAASGSIDVLMPNPFLTERNNEGEVDNREIFPEELKKDSVGQVEGTHPVPGNSETVHVSRDSQGSGHWNPFDAVSSEAAPGFMHKKSESISDAWNPFGHVPDPSMDKASMKCADSNEDSRDGWNPFSSVQPAAKSIPGGDPLQPSVPQPGWNPFDGAEITKEPDDWNPFSTQSSAPEEAKESSDTGWNPFAVKAGPDPVDSSAQWNPFTSETSSEPADAGWNPFNNPGN